MSMFILAIFFIALFSSFIFKRPSEKKQIVLRIIDEVTEKYEKKYGFHLSGIIESCPNGVYRNIGMNFDYEGVLDKSEGRIILTDIVSSLLEAINSKELLKKYLQDVPFTGSNVTVNIYLKSKDQARIYYPNIKIFSFYAGSLRYKYDSPESDKRGGDYFLEEIESLEEAKEIIKN